MSYLSGLIGVLKDLTFVATSAAAGAGAAAAPAPAAAEVATKVRPFITPINPDKYDVRL